MNNISKFMGRTSLLFFILIVSNPEEWNLYFRIVILAGVFFWHWEPFLDETFKGSHKR